MSHPPDFSLVLASMPWATTTRPSLSLGLLAARLRARGFACDVLYPNVFFSALVGAGGYEFLCDTPSCFGLAEHLFATDVFGREALKSDEYLQTFDDGPLDSLTQAPVAAARGTREVLTDLRDRIVPAFLDTYAAEIAERRPDVVGFTCTFNQVMPSVALARRIKQIAPRITVVLGGPCVHGPMGVCYSRVFCDDVDAVFLGEADELFPEYLRRVARGESHGGIPGIAIAGVREGAAPLFHDLDALETPDYSDYIELRSHLEQEGFRLAPVHSLPFEASRGCWWGEKHHCTFCGLNNEGMAFRRKRPTRVVSELAEMANRYGVSTFMAADNILDYRGFEDLLPALASAPTKFDLFFELKTNLRRAQVERLHHAGVTWVQPGIESFSDHVLQLMRKGVSALQNVQALKWLAEFGIRTSYNLLVGFPGETERDYADLLALIRRLHHLPPPGPEANLVQVQRFAPFHFANDALGIGPIRGARFYDHLIPPSVADKDDYAYFFDHDLPHDAAVFKYLDAVNAALDEWCRSGTTCVLRLGRESVQVARQDGAGAACMSLDALSSAMLIVADEIIAESRLVARVVAADLASTVEAAARVDELVRDGLLLRDNGKTLCPFAFETPTSDSELREWLAQFAPALTRPAGYDLARSDATGMIELGTGGNGPSHTRSGA
jgi:ribosomal peptide maturation radical SAM protein 1